MQPPINDQRHTQYTRWDKANRENEPKRNCGQFPDDNARTPGAQGELMPLDMKAAFRQLMAPGKMADPHESKIDFTHDAL